MQRFHSGPSNGEPVQKPRSAHYLDIVAIEVLMRFG